MAVEFPARRPEDVLLDGGPAGVPPVWRTDGALHTRVKVPSGAGQEHYEFSGDYREFDGRNLPVFRWAYRTRVAE